MQLNLGGPVWHASASFANPRASLEAARRALAGVGDARLGAWVEDPGRGVVHVRRRLSAREVVRTGLVVRDIRGTDEEIERLVTLARDAPHTRPYVSRVLLDLGVLP